MKNLEPAEKGETTSVRRWLFPVLVCAAAAIPYLGVPSFGFVFDDRMQILNNPTLLHLSSIPSYFLHHVWSYVPDMGATYYRPLFSTWLNVNYALFAQHAAGWHLSVLCLHLFASLLAYYLVWDVLRSRTTGFLAALLFAVHPVHVESVAWISGSTDPLAAIFVLGSFLTYRKATSARGWIQAGLACTSLLCFACSLLIKETALLFPILVLFDSLFLAQPHRRAAATVTWVVPYLLIVIGYCFIRIEVLGNFGQTHVHLPVSVLLYTLPSVLFFYLGLLLFPAGLSPFYDTPYVNYPGFLHFWMPILVLISIVILIFVVLRHLKTSSGNATDNRKQYSLFLLWTLIFLAPALDLSLLDGGEIVHDRYLYLPSIGFMAMLAFLLYQTAARLAIPQRSQAAAGTALIVLLAAATLTQSYYWKNDFLLYRLGAAMAPANINAQNNLANIYLDSGHFEEGVNLHKRILEKHPGYADSYYNIGMAYYNRQNFTLAQEYFQQAVNLRPQARWYFYLGIARLKNGRAAAAEEALLHAVEGRPGQAEFHAGLGAVYAVEGKTALALKELETAQQLDPANQGLRSEIGRIKQQLRL